MIWDTLAQRITAELAAHPQDYLRQKWISKTMHPYLRPLTYAYWKDLKANEYVQREVLPYAYDGLTGWPCQFDLDPRLSPQTIQHVFYLKLLYEHLGIEIQKLPHIVEIGGGYGNFARIVRRMGHCGRYQIADLPAIHALQRTYLDEALPGHGIEFITLDELPEHADLLVATFSVSEMPMNLRESLEPKYARFDALLFGSTREFDGVDNLVYFRELAKRLRARFIQDPHRGAVFVLCKR